MIRFGREKIKCENCVKFLGILLDGNLSWKYHVNELSKKLSITIGIFHDGLFWPILLLVDLVMSIIRKREQTET